MNATQYGPRLVVSIMMLWTTATAAAFVPGSRWTNTASGLTGQQGDPITLTWSIVPDGTSIPGEGASDLIAFLDTNLGAGPGGDDLTQRPWFRLIDESFARYSELGGVTYLYEANDDGVTHGTAAGRLNVRGDMRIGGTFIDGPSDVLAFNGLPNNGDMALDTGDAAFYRNSAGDFIRFRNVIMHEHGHGFGLFHVESNNASFLMEPFINISFDGPQFDDIRGFQRFYGDVNEKSNGGSGNDIAANATDLGNILDNDSVVIGLDAGTGTRVEADEIDFVSIDDNSDTDFYAFTISDPSEIDLNLTPLGATYNQGPQGGTQSSFDSSSISDLSLALFDTDGESLLRSVDDSLAGEGESILNFELDEAGEYFVRVRGTANNIQFYELEIGVEHLAVDISADFDSDGDVDGDDFLVWQSNFLTTSGASPADGDADGDGDVDGEDFLVWQESFSTGEGAARAAIPEPSGLLLTLLAAAAAASRLRHPAT